MKKEKIKNWLNLGMGLLILIGLVLSFPADLYSQKDQKKIKPKLRLNYTKTIGEGSQLRAVVYYIEKGDRVYCEGAPIGFYSDDTSGSMYKMIEANEKGEAILELGEEELSTFERFPGHYYFYAVIEENDQYQGRDEDLSIFDGTIEVNFIEEDSQKVLEAQFLSSEDSTNEMLPQKSVPLKIFVERALAPLPIGGDFNFTDSQGKIEIEFPEDIPGDKDGRIAVMVKVDDVEAYGTIVFQESITWGKPSFADNPVAERSLIGARENAPVFMVISINLILLGIWGYLVYLVIGLIQIKTSGKANT